MILINIKLFIENMDRLDRAWMYTRRLPREKYLSDEFISGVENFIEFAKSHPNFMSGGRLGALVQSVEMKCFKA